MIHQHRPLAAALVAGLAVTTGGCGDIWVTGEFGDEPLNVTGTVVAWLDETEYAVKDPDDAPTLIDRTTDDIVLYLRFYEAVFDGNADFGALPSGERARIQEDIDRGDQLLLEIRRGNVLRKEDKIHLVEDVGELPPEVLPYIAALDVHFGAPALDGQTKYPEHAPTLGGKRKASFVVDDTSPELSGDIIVSAKKEEGEDDGYVTGKIGVRFTVELLPERLAECNFAPAGAGDVDPCTLNPLPSAGLGAAGQ